MLPENLCLLSDGIATQIDKSLSVLYNEDYFNKYIQYENSNIGITINKDRLDITLKYAHNGGILDIGIGCGTFLNTIKDNKKYGTDINPRAISWLRERNLYIDPYKMGIPTDIRCITFWDSLEHFPDPSEILYLINKDTFCIFSIPIVDIDNISLSKHYRPNEHYWYFNIPGFIKYMTRYGFEFKEMTDFEMLAGRDSIYTFVFKKLY